MPPRKKSSGREVISARLIELLTRLNSGETLDIHQLRDQYRVSLRTIQRDINRLGELTESTKGRYYRLNTGRHGLLSRNEIERFCRFASIQDLFPETDRRFFLDKLAQSVTVKGFQYEDIKSRQHEFDLVTQAIDQRNPLTFSYAKSDGSVKNYRIEPYRLVNKNGIWYLIGLDHGKQKTFCFSQIRQPQKESDTFLFDSGFAQTIDQTDSLYHGNHIGEIVVRIAARAAPYFTRRALLPNQETVRSLEDGSLLLACKNVNPMEVVPIVQYWIPHVSIVSPAGLQEQMERKLRAYLDGKGEEKWDN
jgi:transcriptional regulator-like protein, helix-turn-helix domain-containing protein